MRASDLGTSFTKNQKKKGTITMRANVRTFGMVHTVCATSFGLCGATVRMCSETRCSKKAYASCCLSTCVRKGHGPVPARTWTSLSSCSTRIAYLSSTSHPRSQSQREALARLPAASVRGARPSLPGRCPNLC